MAELKETPSQTAGPYVHIGCVPSFAGLAGMYDADLGSALAPDTPGDPIRIEGRIYDGAGEIVRDAMVESWQADGSGAFGVWLRQATDLETGIYRFDTVLPAAVGDAAPHVSLWIVARGINLALSTRVYFPGETSNSRDPLLIKAGARSDTLIARRPDAEEDERDAGMPVYRFDIRLQGERETVFLDV